MVDSGEAALEYLKEHRPNLIFMDHLMPGIDGFETTRAIKQNPATSALPVIMCTSNEGEEYVARARSIGAIDILPKPPTENKLHKILGELISRPIAAQVAQGAPINSAANIETIAHNAAQAAVRASLDSLVQRLLESRLAELRHEVEQWAEARVREIAEQAVNQASERILDEALTAARLQTETIAEAVVREAASGILESGKEEARRSAEHAATATVQAWQKEWQATEDQLLSEVETRADTAAKAAVTALRSANEDALKSASQAAEKAAGQAAERVGMVIMDSIDKDLGKGKLYASAAAFVGVLAAIVVYVMG